MQMFRYRNAMERPTETVI